MEEYTSFHGDVINTDYQHIVDVFGQPTDCELDKSQCEWFVTTDKGTEFYIYDWKEFTNVKIAENVEWHIGRTAKAGVREDIAQFLKDKGFDLTNIYMKP